MGGKIVSTFVFRSSELSTTAGYPGCASARDAQPRATARAHAWTIRILVASEKHVKLREPQRLARVRRRTGVHARSPERGEYRVEAHVHVRQEKPDARKPDVRGHRLTSLSAVHDFSREHRMQTLNGLVVRLREPGIPAPVAVPRERLVHRVNF